MTTITLGTCSICGGPVTTPRVLGIVGPPPAPTCANCGAVPADGHGPVIQMRPKGKAAARDTTHIPLHKVRG